MEVINHEAVEYLEKAGVGKRVRGRFRVVADSFRAKVVTHKVTKDKGLLIALENELARLEMVFVLSDRFLLWQLRRIIDELLDDGSRLEVV